MIDIPPGSSPSTRQTASVSAPDVDSVKAAVQVKLEAVVQQVQARHRDGQADSKSWDILLRLNPQASGTPVKADALTPELMRAIQAGQPVLLQTRANLMLPVDARLQVAVSISQGVQIQAVQPPPLPPQALVHLKQFIHQQQPMAPLLTNLLHLSQRGQQDQLAALPLRTQAAIAQVIAALPDPQAVRDQLKTWVNNSGLLQEAKLAQLLKPGPDIARSQVTGTDTIAKSATSAAQTGTALQQVRHQIQALVQRLTPASGETPTARAPSSSFALPAAIPAAALNAMLEGDIKHALQQLERQLQGAEGAKPVRLTQPENAGKPATGAAANATPNDPDAIPAQAASERKPGQPLEIARRMEGAAKESVLNTATTTTPAKSPLAIQRYQAGANTGATAKTALDGAIPDLIPPLPGQVVVQAQPRGRPTLKDGDMADAIVKTLLAQVRGALARVTLHQLSSHNRQDSPTPTSLSFEIPFLHHQQINVFQFRIDEETPQQEEQEKKSHAKRWVVQLGFDIEGLGPMFCQLSLTGKAMAVQFWAAWENTLNSTKAHFGFLEKSLQDMGISVEKIQAQLGMPEIDRTGVRNQLVDIKT